MTEIRKSGGEHLVRTDFNATGSKRVERFKRTMAALIDGLNRECNAEFASVRAMDCMEDAAMHGVKVLTSEYAAKEPEYKVKEDLLPHEQRVVEELAQLDERMEKLQLFMTTDIYAGLKLPDQVLLRNQLAFMQEYAHILRQRIMRF